MVTGSQGSLSWRSDAGKQETNHQKAIPFSFWIIRLVMCDPSNFTIYIYIYTRTWKSVHMWNQGKNCMGRRAFRKSNKSMQPGLKLHGTHYVEVLLLDPWQCTFLLANFPNPHQDACAQLCPIILKIYAKFSKSPSGRVCTVMSHNLKNIYPRMLNTMWTLIQTCTLIPTNMLNTKLDATSHRLPEISPPPRTHISLKRIDLHN